MNQLKSNIPTTAERIRRKIQQKSIFGKDIRLACGHTKDEITDYPCTCGCHLDIGGNK